MDRLETPSHLVSSRRPRLWRMGAGVLIFIFSALAGPAQDISNTNDISEALPHLGKWIWDTHTADKQTCRFWKSFEIPRGATVTNAVFYITADNSYSLFLDGREIGRGSDWRTLTEYDAKLLLKPGVHVLVVDAFNDRLAGGLLFGSQIEMANRKPIEIFSDTTWKVIPSYEKNWAGARRPGANWQPTVVVGNVGELPWTPWPIGVMSVPPLRPVTLYFWQTLWFQITTLTTLGTVVVICLWLLAQLTAQSKAQRLLHLQRARIARDIHDDLGARLTQLVLLGEIAQSELPAQSETRAQIDRICEQARDLGHAMDEVVWAVSSRRDTLRDFAAYVCKHAQLFLKDTPIRCRLDVEPELPPAPFDLASRRNLLLAVKEAIHNAAKHSGAGELILRIHRQGDGVRVVVEDDGNGFVIARMDPSRNGMTNMTQRMQEVGGQFTLYSAPGMGCRIEFNLPLIHAHGRLRWLRRKPDELDETELASPADLPAPENENNPP